MSQFTVSREATISASASALYARIIDFHEWTAWSPWENLDTNLERTYSGAQSGVGAEYAWSGKKSGAGSMRIIAAEEPTDTETGSIEIDLRFTKPMKANNLTVFTFVPLSATQTRVQWDMSGSNDTFFKRAFAKVFSMDKMVGGDFEKGLAALATATAH